MSRFALFLAFVVALLGCAPPARPPAYGLDSSFTDAEVWEIYQAARDWDEHVYPDRRIEVGSTSWSWFIARGDLGGAFGGWSSRDSRVITLDEDLPVSRVREVARHEMGHALGMGHVRRGWMQAVTMPDVPWTEDDRAECKRVGACP